MLGILRAGLALGAALLLIALLPVGTHAHAALSRSDPSAGAALTEPPAEIRLWFTEPLEASYTGADLFDGAGEPIAGVTSSVAPDDAYQLVVVPPVALPDGGYTIAWRTLSAADGHTLQGYFGFSVGGGTAGAAIAPPLASSLLDNVRALTRGLALLGLAAIAAIAPMMLGVLNPVAGDTSGFGRAMRLPLRRYAVAAAALALLGSVAALAAQAAAIAPDAFLPVAMVQTLADTRYGQLWLLRLGLLLLCFATIAFALWGPERWRRAALITGAALTVALPLPFSLLSHAAAQQDGRSAAIAADALHLLAASVWVGGLFMFVLVLLPTLRSIVAGERKVMLRAVLPRFSVIGLTAWGVLALTGLYAAWLQVGTTKALWETPYGQSLVLKGALLLPILALAAFHLVLGRSDLEEKGSGRFAGTIVAEAVLVVAVMLVVGRLIGLEPAREVLASRTPTQVVATLTFATNDGNRDGQLTISPGATGTNSFTIEIAGAPLPEGSEGVLRFELADREMGAQELLLPAAGQNRFQAEGPELALPGSWRIQTVVRAIGAYSWTSEVIVPIDETPPPAAEPNPAPLFTPGGIGGMIAIAIGAAGLAAAVASRSTPMSRRGGVAAAGVIALAAGAVILSGSRIPPVAVQAPVVAQEVSEAASSPAATAAHDAMMSRHDHATPVPASATPEPLPGPGTPVSGDGISVRIAAAPRSAGPVDVSVDITGEDGSPVSGARVAVLSDMPEMAMGSTETPAVETAPGRYVAEFVPLGMAGEWRLAVRVSPTGASTQVFSFTVLVP